MIYNQFQRPSFQTGFIFSITKALYLEVKNIYMYYDLSLLGMYHLEQQP